MIPGDVIAWCCNAHTSAVDILEEYGAIVVDNAGEEGFDACAGTAVALHGAAGASAYS
jgi:hypothetical protein